MIDIAPEVIRWWVREYPQTLSYGNAAAVRLLSTRMVRAMKRKRPAARRQR